MMLLRIVSGGQTGADRGGLDAAIELGIDWGGWAPQGWRSEDGQIPAKYRERMRCSASAGYPVRTRKNIEDSDGTLIVSLGQLRADSGSIFTHNEARRLSRPVLHMTIDRLAHDIGAAFFLGWIEGHRLQVLNVAGPRESREPGIQQATRSALLKLSLINSPRTGHRR